MRILRAADYRRMPWKNGAGETVEIAVFPEGAYIEDFDWRVSMASVVTDGAFSLFPGVDRTLSILEGEGLSLSVEGHDAVNLRIDSEPYGFPADLPTKARLKAGPVADLNVMTRRDRYVHRVARQVGQRFELDARQATVLAMGLGTLGSEGGDIVLHSLDAIVLDHGQQVVLIADRDVSLFVVEIAASAF